MVIHSVRDIIKTTIFRLGVGITNNKTTLAYSLSIAIPSRFGIRFVYAWSRDGSYQKRFGRFGDVNFGGFEPGKASVIVYFWKFNFGISVVFRKGVDA